MKYSVLSFDSKRKDAAPYIVEAHNNGKTWSCTCPHWIHRLRGSGTHCKHIDKVIDDNERNQRAQSEIAAQFEQGYGTDWEDSSPSKPDDPEMDARSAV